MKQVVVDASLAIKWVVPEVYQAEALSLIAVWNADGVEVVVPSWFACEVANVLFQRVRRGALTLSDTRIAFGAINSKVMVRRDVDSESVALRATELASLLGMRSSYDAQYLALAEHLRCELWTADDRFRVAVKVLYPRVKWAGEAEVLSIPQDSNRVS
jgi:predicted nucleic acid-binding protein